MYLCVCYAHQCGMIGYFLSRDDFHDMNKHFSMVFNHFHIMIERLSYCLSTRSFHTRAKTNHL